MVGSAGCDVRKGVMEEGLAKHLYGAGQSTCGGARGARQHSITWLAQCMGAGDKLRRLWAEDLLCRRRLAVRMNRSVSGERRGGQRKAEAPRGLTQVGMEI